MLVQLRIVLSNNVQCLHQSNTMSSTNQFTGPSASTVAMSARQEFTPEQLERIKSVVDCLVTSSGLERTPGSAVADFLHTQDLMSCRTGPIIPVEQSPPISFLDLPAEVRNKIYHHCLVVGKVFPRAKPHDDERFKGWMKHRKPQTQLLLVCKQVFLESAPMYFSQNQFVMSHGPASEWPWARPDALHDMPVSRFAYQNLRMLTQGFELLLRNSLVTEWSTRQNKIMAMPLETLEIVMDNCFCMSTDYSMYLHAVRVMQGRLQSGTQVVMKWLDGTEEASIALEEVNEFWDDVYDLDQKEPYSDQLFLTFKTAKKGGEPTRSPGGGW
ncbi:hypothetical protein D6D05_03869 [Aureobasidium pullulans]|nr:hypothetical protein D6D05_03869 [Aureobasidium pullulans]